MITIAQSVVDKQTIEPTRMSVHTFLRDKIENKENKSERKTVC